METLSYEIIINASKQRIWDILWGEKTYGEWTQFFCPGSVLRSDWKVNGKTYFLDESGDGMVSTIESLEEPDQIVFKHLGIVNEGVEDTQSKGISEWSGAYEKYILIDFDGKTKLHAELQTGKEYRDHMNKGFEMGFEMVKKLAEKP